MRPPWRSAPAPAPGAGPSHAPTASAPQRRIRLMWRAHALVLLALAAYHVHLLQRAHDLRQFEAHLSAVVAAPAPSVAPLTTNLAANAASKGYDCAIYWLRLPKTASTSIQHSFIGPMVSRKMFSNTEQDPNTCIEGVGGCAPFWEDRQRTSTRRHRKRSHTPPYGVALSSESRPVRLERHNQRCFPHEDLEELYCNEYDPHTSTLNFGPHRHQFPKSKHKRVGTSIYLGRYRSGPELKTHVGLDPSQFGWILPPRPLVFSTFREPLARFLSGFGYGMTLGAGRPGQVFVCELPTKGSFDEWNEQREHWEQQVVEARRIATVRNDTRPYQRLLRDYLDACGEEVDNVYVSFLDPRTKDIRVALENLERHVIVGLQDDLDRTLVEWRNITLHTCADHPRFLEMQELMAKEAAIHDHGHNYRKAATQVGGDKNGDNRNGEAEIVKLADPDIESFDFDLQRRIRNMIAGDEVIYKRVLEMYYAGSS